MASRSTSGLLTICQFSGSDFVVPDNFCSRIFLERFFVVFWVFEAGVGICVFVKLGVSFESFVLPTQAYPAIVIFH
jgi:hypothetical protein